MSDEEKEAIEELKNKKADYFMISDLTGKTLLNLIEKQSKEIEHQKEKRENQKKELAILNAKQIEFNKLVNTVNSYKGQFKRQQKEIESLKEDKEIIKRNYEDLVDENEKFLYDSAVYLMGKDDTNSKWEDKIKAVIEEIKSRKIANEEIKQGIIKVLQSLLEKE